jgi:hypothetical protein
MHGVEIQRQAAEFVDNQQLRQGGELRQLPILTGLFLPRAKAPHCVVLNREVSPGIGLIHLKALPTPRPLDARQSRAFSETILDACEVPPGSRAPRMEQHLTSWPDRSSAE